MHGLLNVKIEDVISMFRYLGALFQRAVICDV